MKKYVSLLLIILLFFSFSISSFAENEVKYEAEYDSFRNDFDASSFVLMEAETGNVLAFKNSDTALPPASVTKIMTLLIAAEALETGSIHSDDKVRVSAKAASLGGSQVFLSEGEEISVAELIKCTVIASANDAAVALAELISGSEEAFVAKMNSRAAELGMNATHFENATGLDDTVTDHVTSAMDIAIMSRELIKHDSILKYSSLWQDSIRDGEFILTNTNRLVRFYDGCTGLKTGSTDKAGFCISATAKRGNMHLIAVIMGAKTRDARNEMARKLLDYGFAAYTLCEFSEEAVKEVPINYGEYEKIGLFSSAAKVLVPKGASGSIEKITYLPESLDAPVEALKPVGRIEYVYNGEKLGESIVYTKEGVNKITLIKLFASILIAVFED